MDYCGTMVKKRVDDDDIAVKFQQQCACCGYSYFVFSVAICKYNCLFPFRIRERIVFVFNDDRGFVISGSSGMHKIVLESFFILSSFPILFEWFHARVNALKKNYCTNLSKNCGFVIGSPNS